MAQPPQFPSLRRQKKQNESVLSTQPEPQWLTPLIRQFFVLNITSLAENEAVIRSHQNLTFSVLPWHQGCHPRATLYHIQTLADSTGSGCPSITYRRPQTQMCQLDGQQRHRCLIRMFGFVASRNRISSSSVRIW